MDVGVSIKDEDVKPANATPDPMHIGNGTESLPEDIANRSTIYNQASFP